MRLEKMQKIIIYLLLSFSILGCSAKSNATNSHSNNDNKEYDYIIKIDINASKEKVWSVLTNFQNYSKWNSVLKMEDNDNLELGKKFDVTIFNNDDSIADSFQAITMHKTNFQSFSASQTIVSEKIFKATHYFIIKETSKNRVQFIQKWELEGVVAYLFESMILDVLELFKTMNKELKGEVEKL